MNICRWAVNVTGLVPNVWACQMGLKTRNCDFLETVYNSFDLVPVTSMEPGQLAPYTDGPRDRRPGFDSRQG
jgi:hypothetical protein